MRMKASGSKKLAAASVQAATGTKKTG